MKKLVMIALALICVIGLLGCNNAKQDEVTTYDFSGRNEYFTISNGSIILSGDGQKFYGGELTITQPAIFENITWYSTCFYTLKNGERTQFCYATTTGLDGNSVPNGNNLGYTSTNGHMISNLEGGLWFELATIDVDGTQNVYQMKLELTK